MTTTQTVTIERPDAQQLMAQANTEFALAQAYIIDSDETLQLAADDLRSIKQRVATLDERRKAITKPLDAAKAAVMDLFRPAIERLTAAEALLKNSILTYQDKREAERRAEQARIEAAARAEQARLANEARAAAEEAARIAAEAQAALSAGQSEQAAQLAEQAQAAEETAAAAIAISESVVAPLPIVADVAKPAGIAARGTVEAEVEDKLAFVRFVAAHPELIHLVNEDSVKLRSYARALGDGVSIPGVRVFIKRSIAARKTA